MVRYQLFSNLNVYDPRAMRQSTCDCLSKGDELPQFAQDSAKGSTRGLHAHSVRQPSRRERTDPEPQYAVP